MANASIFVLGWPQYLPGSIPACFRIALDRVGIICLNDKLTTGSWKPVKPFVKLSQKPKDRKIEAVEAAKTANCEAPCKRARARAEPRARFRA